LVVRKLVALQRWLMVLHLLAENPGHGMCQRKPASSKSSLAHALDSMRLSLACVVLCASSTVMQVGPHAYKLPCHNVIFLFSAPA
jgi:hypothetical protein